MRRLVDRREHMTKGRTNMSDLETVLGDAIAHWNAGNLSG